jgi:hypothetical protein
MTSADELAARLKSCPRGTAGWQQFEETGLETLQFLFVPPLVRPVVQPRTLHGTNRRDAVFPNRIFDLGSPWGQLRHDLAAQLILVEFKNYDLTEIGQEEALQTADYLHNGMGKLAILCCNKEPGMSAKQKRNTVFSRDGKVVLFVTTDHLVEMLGMKDRGVEPGGLILDLVDRFMIQHE